MSEHSKAETDRLWRDIEEFAKLAACVYPDGSMSVSFKAGRIPASSFEALYAFAIFDNSRKSAFDEPVAQESLDER